MLDDPFWAWSTKLGSRVNKSRQEDKPALIELVQIVSRSDSLHQFSEQRIALPNGGTISCREIGNGIAVSLQEEEKDHQNRMIAKFKSLRLDPSMNGQHSLTDEAFLGILLALSTTFAHDDWFLAARAGLATAAYTGYMVCRAYFYANKRPKNVSEVNIDPNDCEDAYICLHIDLAQRDVLVTSDKGTIEALTRTTDLMNARLKPEVPRRCVMHTDEFLARLDSLTSIG